jgi:hypothetical protein
MKKIIAISAAAGITAGLAAGAPGLIRALTPDYQWCAEHHLVCHFGGAMEADPIYWSNQAQMKRLLETIRQQAKPLAITGPAAGLEPSAAR